MLTSAAALKPTHCTNWVQCERCQKWRRITDEYARTVDDDVEWWATAGLL